MKPNTFLPAFAFLLSNSFVEAHTRFTTLHIKGQSQGDGVCIRQDQNPGTTTNFVPSITGPEMACGIDGTIPNPSTCSVNAGDQISLEHRMYPDGSQPGAIDVSHKGNTAIYMKKISSQSDEVTGGGWFKIHFDGYDQSTGQWGTDHMNANGGLVTTNIPNDLAPGNYLIRSEVLALQQVGDPQMYVGCAQVSLTGSGSAAPSDTVTIPGYIDMSTPAMGVNIYQSFTFTEYGPQVYGPGGKGTTGSSVAKPSTTSTSNSGSTASTSNTGPVAPKVSSAPNVGVSPISPTTGNIGAAHSGDISSYSQTDDVHDDGYDVDNDDKENDDGEDDDEEVEEEQSASDSSHHGYDSWHSWSAWNHARVRASRTIHASRHQ